MWHITAGNATWARPVTAGMASLAQARQDRPGLDGGTTSAKVRQARRVLDLEATHGGSPHGRHGAAWFALAIHGRHGSGGPIRSPTVWQARRDRSRRLRLFMAG